MLGNIWIADWLVSPQEGLSSMELGERAHFKVYYHITTKSEREWEQNEDASRSVHHFAVSGLPRPQFNMKSGPSQKPKVVKIETQCSRNRYFPCSVYVCNAEYVYATCHRDPCPLPFPEVVQLVPLPLQWLTSLTSFFWVTMKPASK